MWREQLREPSLSGIRCHSRAGRTLSPHPCPGLVLPLLCCSKQDKSKAGPRAKPSGLPAPGSVLYIYCLGAEKAAGCAQAGIPAGIPPHPSLLGGQRGNPRSSYGLFSPLTGRRKDPGGEKPFVLNIPQQVPVTGSQVPQPIPKLRTPCIYLHPASLSHLPVNLLALPPHQVCQAAVGPAEARKVTCGTGR